MILSAEEDGKDAEALRLVVDFKIEDGAFLCYGAQARSEVWAERALVRLPSEGAHGSFEA